MRNAHASRRRRASGTAAMANAEISAMLRILNECQIANALTYKGMQVIWPKSRLSGQVTLLDVANRP